MRSKNETISTVSNKFQLFKNSANKGETLEKNFHLAATQQQRHVSADKLMVKLGSESEIKRNMKSMQKNLSKFEWWDKNLHCIHVRVSSLSR